MVSVDTYPSQSNFSKFLANYESYFAKSISFHLFEYAPDLLHCQLAKILVKDSNCSSLINFDCENNPPHGS